MSRKNHIAIMHRPSQERKSIIWFKYRMQEGRLLVLANKYKEMLIRGKERRLVSISSYWTSLMASRFHKKSRKRKLKKRKKLHPNPSHLKSIIKAKANKNLSKKVKPEKNSSRKSNPNLWKILKSSEKNPCTSNKQKKILIQPKTQKIQRTLSLSQNQTPALNNAHVKRAVRN